MRAKHAERQRQKEASLFVFLVLGIRGGNGNQPEIKRNGKGVDWSIGVCELHVRFFSINSIYRPVFQSRRPYVQLPQPMKTLMLMTPMGSQVMLMGLISLSLRVSPILVILLGYLYHHQILCQFFLNNLIPVHGPCWKILIKSLLKLPRPLNPLLQADGHGPCLSRGWGILGNWHITKYVVYRPSLELPLPIQD